MRSLNLDQLRALQAIAATGGFTAAARQLHLSQSAVSVQIRELEARVGVKLLDRVGKKAILTSAGRELIGHAAEIATRTDGALEAMRRYREGWLGQVRIGASTTALIYHLPPVLARVRRDHPNIELRVGTGTTTSVAERLLDNEIDLAVVSLPIDARGLEVAEILREPLMAIFPPGVEGLPKTATPDVVLAHPLIVELGHAHIKKMTIAWLTRGGVPPRPAMELDNLEAIVRMVAAGLGASIVPIAAVPSRLHASELQALPLRPALFRTLALVQLADRAASEAVASVRAAILALRDATPI